uniref:uncharacterized protein LOC101305241 n=1 Tax=Fragaria vesca subsp. vesca TaxID=101020 RepID=UPI0005C8ADBD|nr:PREDICTED: uncharacterized protein LOC101305241 [Fragaria vesca subsp. vesca]XP_011458291.1 PREDICTED: uncharacterized protein LOC101305241 [Fragaria vesca subsp. vesca]
MPSDFIGREDQWEFLCQHFESDAFKRLSLANKWNRGEKTMHHHTGSSPIIYAMEELRIQEEQLPIIKGFEKTYVRAGDEDTTKKYNDMVDEVNKRNDAFKEQHPDATEEEIMESVQSQQIVVLGKVLKTRKGKEIRGMGQGGKRDLSQSSNGSTSRSRPPRVDEQQLQEMQECYEQRLKESEERAQQQYQEVHQRALRAESMYSVVQSQFAAIYERLGMPPPPPVVSPPHVSLQNNDDLGDNIELDNRRPWNY